MAQELVPNMIGLKIVPGAVSWHLAWMAQLRQHWTLAEMIEDYPIRKWPGWLRLLLAVSSAGTTWTLLSQAVLMNI